MAKAKRSKRAHYWVGTSGWTYSHWKPDFYPKGLQQRDWLGYYAEYLPSVEINATFYRQPQIKMLEGWYERTPDDFRFSAKAWRLLTHNRRLVDCAEAIDTFFERLETLAEKCPVVLFQLPPRFPANTERLDEFLSQLPADWRYAFEFRDPDWHQEATYEVLRRHNAAFSPFDFAGLTGPRVMTADFTYVRLHGHEQRYTGAYTKRQLSSWATWLGKQLSNDYDVYVFFDNTDQGTDAVDNALQLQERLAAKARQ